MNPKGEEWPDSLQFGFVVNDRLLDCVRQIVTGSQLLLMV